MTWLLYLQLALWGYVLYGFGPVVALLREEQHVSRSVASLHTTALAVGVVIGGGMFAALTRRFGRPATMWGGLALLVVSVLALCEWRPIAATLTSTVFLALAGTLVVCGVFPTLSEMHANASHATIAEANAMACALGAVAPLLVGVSVGAGWSWRPGMAVVVPMIGLLAVGAWLLRVRIPRGTPAPAGHEAGRLPFGYWLAWISITLTGAIEICLGLWAVEVLRVRDGMSAGTAASAVSEIGRAHV